MKKIGWGTCHITGSAPGWDRRRSSGLPEITFSPLKIGVWEEREDHKLTLIRKSEKPKKLGSC